jgi:hypothetical protein
MFFESLEMGSNNPVTWRDSTRVGADAFSCTKRKRKKREMGNMAGSKNGFLTEPV